MRKTLYAPTEERHAVKRERVMGKRNAPDRGVQMFIVKGRSATLFTALLAIGEVVTIIADTGRIISGRTRSGFGCTLLRINIGRNIRSFGHHR